MELQTAQRVCAGMQEILALVQPALIVSIERRLRLAGNGLLRKLLPDIVRFYRLPYDTRVMCCNLRPSVLHHSKTVKSRRVGWEWASVDGNADLVGPADTFDGFAAENVPQLLRDVFTAAGGTHDDWDEYDRVMAEDGRTAVFIHAVRIQGRG